jgi:uncharacterized protein YbjT (DUF2867 family)
MKLIITGGTGTAGSQALRQALADPRVEKVTALSRKPLGIENPKLRVILLADFLDYSPVLEDLKDHKACLWCLGISQNAVSSDGEYELITYDYALAGAKAMASVNPDFTFCFLSGAGADSAEKSSVLFARIKGKTENALGRLGLPHLYHFRPGYIHPTADQPKKLFYERLFEPVTPLFYKFLPGMIISSTDLGKAMIEAAIHGAPKTILENNDIRRLVPGAR